jgi:hypothetical protein
LTYVFPYIGLQLDKIFLSAEVSPANYGATSISARELYRKKIRKIIPLEPKDIIAVLLSFL